MSSAPPGRGEDRSMPEAGPSRPRDMPPVAAVVAAAAIDLTEEDSPPPRTTTVGATSSPNLSDILDEQLPALDASTFVPLGPIIDRTAKVQYESLKELVKETLPSLPPRERPKHIISYAQSSRSALLKLLALLRWKKQADVWRYERPRAGLGSSASISGSISLPKDSSSASLNGQDTSSLELVGPVTEALRLTSWADDQHEHIIRLREHLRTVLDQVTNLRLQEPDLATVLDVLGSGSYTRLPRVVTRPYQDERLDEPSEVLKTIEEMDKGLKYRLAVAEVMPTGLSVVDIRDGKAYLRAPGLFRCTLTTTTTDLRNSWYLVDVDFDTQSTTAESKPSSSTRLPDPVREQIIQAVEPLLVYTPLRDVVGSNDEVVGGERNAVLFKLFEILQSLSLSYRIESLYLQAVHLVKNGWHDRIRVEMRPDRKGIRIDYWSPIGPSTSIKSEEYAGSITAHICRVAASSSDLLLGPEHQYGQLHERQEIKFTCQTKEQWLGLNCTAGGLDEGTLATAGLDLEQILTDVMERHADGLARSFQEFVIARIANGVDAVFVREDVQLSHATSGTAILIRIYGSRWLSVKINPSNGRFDIKEAEIIVGSILEARLAGGAKYANMHPDKLMDVLTSLRTTLIMEATEEKLSSLKCRVSRQVPGSSEDHERIGLYLNGRGTRQLKPVLSVSLPSSRDHVMLLVLSGRVLQAGVASVQSSPEGNSLKKRLARVVWLDRDLVSQASVPMLNLDPGTEDLRGNLALSSAMACMESVATQFLHRGITCEAVPSTSPPALHVRGRDVFKHGAGSRVILRLLDWRNPARMRMEATYRLPGNLSQLADIDADSASSHILVIKRKGDFIKVTSDQLPSFTQELIAHCEMVDNSLMLAKRVLKEQDQHAQLTLARFSLGSMSLEYDKSPFVRLEYQSDKGRYAVNLTAPLSPSTGWLAPLIEAQLATAFNEAWRSGSPLLSVFNDIPKLLPILDAINLSLGSGEVRLLDLHQWLIIWTVHTQRFALFVRHREDDQLFIIQDAALSATHTAASLAIDGLHPSPDAPAIFKAIGLEQKGTTLDAGKILVVQEAEASTSIPAVIQQFEQALQSDRKPMANGTA